MSGNIENVSSENQRCDVINPKGQSLADSPENSYPNIFETFQERNFCDGFNF